MFGVVGPDLPSPKSWECPEVCHPGLDLGVGSLARTGHLGSGAWPLLGQEQSPRQPQLAGKDSTSQEGASRRLLFKNLKAACFALPRFCAQCEGLASSF